MDVWASGDAYEPYIGRWSQLVAHEFLAWIDVPRGAQWLDVGCGTGALTDVIVREARPAAVHSIDQSPAYIAFARRRVPDPRAAFIVADARSLPQRTGSVDVVVSGLALNFIPRPDVALAEIARVVRAGGAVAAYVWDYAEGMQLIRHLRARRGSSLSRLQPRGAGDTLSACRIRHGRDACDRCSDALPGFRRLLDAVSGRPGTGARLRHEPE
jgi:trans-aconitate methyltransferase